MKGCLYGQAVGDALGLCSEFKSKQETAQCFSPMLRYYSQFYPSGLGVRQDRACEPGRASVELA